MSLSLKKKLQDTIEQHKKEINDNLRDKAIHIGNLKNIKPGDLIWVYYGNFYNSTKYAEVYLIDRKINTIYIHLNYRIMRFNVLNCEEWELDHKKPNKESTTMKENRELADSFGTLIKYPIINVKYKDKMPVSTNHLCCDTENFNVCSYLTWDGEHYFCTHLREFLFKTGFVRLNSKGCLTHR